MKHNFSVYSTLASVRGVTGISVSSPDMYRRFRYEPWTGSM